MKNRTPGARGPAVRRGRHASPDRQRTAAAAGATALATRGGILAAVSLLVGGILAQPAATAQQAPAAPPSAALRVLTTPDGSRCILLPTGGPRIVHWTIFTPAGPNEDPEGLEGLSFAVARASMAGTTRVGSRNRATEEDLLARVDENERKRAVLQGAGRALPEELLNSLQADSTRAEAVADRLAWERALRQAPAGASRLSRTADGTLLHLCLPVEAIGRVAALLTMRREEPVLRGIHDELRAVRADIVAGAALEPWTAVRDEVRSLAFGALPAGRPTIADIEGFRPLSRAQALEVFVRTQRPDRSLHVLAGGFDAEVEAETLVRAFASTSLTEEPIAAPRPLAEQRGERTSQLTGGPLFGVAIALRVPPATDPDAVAIATAWLAGGDDSFLARWLNAQGVRVGALRGTYPFPSPGPLALVLLEVAVDDRDGGNEERVARLLTEVDAALLKASKQAPLPQELLLSRAQLTAERATLCAAPDRLATFVAIRCASFGLPAEQALRPLEDVSDQSVADVLRLLLMPERRVRVTQRRRRRRQGRRPRGVPSGWRRRAGVVCLLPLGGCLLFDAVIETRSVPTDPPPAAAAPGATPGDAPPAPGQGAPEGPGAVPSPPAEPSANTEPPGPATNPASIAAVGPARAGQDQAVPATEVAMVHGLLVVTPLQLAPQIGVPGVLRLTLPVGARAGKPGLAELAAEVLAELRVPTRTGGSLRGALARVGAALDVRVSANATAFEVLFPPARWREVLAVLGEHLAQPLDPSVPSEAFNALRVHLANRLGRAWSRAPLAAMVERMRGGRAQALAEILSEINLRTAAEVAVFQRARYRAAGAVLAVWVPGISGAEFALGLLTSLPPWLDPALPATPLPLQTPLPMESGVFWAPREGPIEVAVLLAQPSLDQLLAAELLVLHECLTYDGLGGRLGLAIEELVGRDVSFELLPADETDQIVLLARAQPSVVVPLWQATSQVLNSFRLRPPTEIELREATARARLRLLQQIARPSDWLRLVSRLAYRRMQPDVIEKTLMRLSTPGQLDIEAALPVFAKSALALAVVGGEPPAQSARLVQLVSGVVLPGERVERIVPPQDLAAAEAEAEAVLGRAAEAAGGKEVLRAMLGYRERVVTDNGVGPSIETETAVRLPARMRQTTRILSTTVTTRIDTEGGVETAGPQEIPIAVDEARGRLAAAARHPAAVLARWCQGQIRFRRLALRMAGDREHVVLEETTDRKDGMRIALDTGSYLIRSIEVRTWNAETGTLIVREEFMDYRTVKGGLRVPFLRTRTVDEREPALRSRVLDFDASEPADADLR